MLIMKKIIPFILLTIICLFMLNANPFDKETVAPMDLLSKYPGWASTPVKAPNIHPERSDVVDYKLPNWIYVKNRIRGGEFPTWNYVHSGGTPGAQLFTSSIFTPAFMAFLAVRDNATGFYFASLVNIIICSFGMFLFISAITKGNIYASLFGAVVFTFCGFNSAWFFWHHVNTSIWIPWLLFAAVQYLKSERSEYLVLVTFSSLMMIFGGFPSVAVYGYISFSLLVVVYNIKNYESPKKFIIKSVLPFIFVGFSFLIALFSLYPLLESFKVTGYFGKRHGGTNYKLKDFILLYKPYKFGIPRVEKTLYVGRIPLFLSVIGAYIYLFVKRSSYLLFGLWLLLISTVITFGLIHYDLIRMIPTFNKNPWNRMNVILSLSIAIISSYAIYHLSKKMKKIGKNAYIAAVLVFDALFAYQILDQKRLFNSFNNAVPNESFYPDTPSIEYARKNILPMQSVLADSSYIISGTLGAYDLPEWFAHGIKSDKDKQTLARIVDDPFKSPTAAAFTGDKIQFESNLINLLGIKYILCNSNSIKENLFVSYDKADKQVPAPPLPQNSLTQVIRLEKDITASGAALLLATYFEPSAPDDVLLTLSENGNAMSKVKVDKEAVRDNRWVYFDFGEELALVSGVEYSIAVELGDYTGDKRLTVWASEQKKAGDNYLIVNGKPSNLTFRMKLYGNNLNINDIYNIKGLERGITLLENKVIKGGAYFIGALDENISPDYSEVALVDFRNNEVTIDYTGARSGWVVLPVRSYPGWNAYLDGAKVEPSLFLEMLPAIKVDRPGKIVYKYEPKMLYLTALVSLVSLVIFILVSIMMFMTRKDETDNTDTVLQ